MLTNWTFVPSLFFVLQLLFPGFIILYTVAPRAYSIEILAAIPNVPLLQNLLCFLELP